MKFTIFNIENKMHPFTYRTKLEFLSQSLELIVLAERIDPFIIPSLALVSGI